MTPNDLETCAKCCRPEIGYCGVDAADSAIVKFDDCTLALGKAVWVFDEERSLGPFHVSDQIEGGHLRLAEDLSERERRNLYSYLVLARGPDA